jgi:hypothetical protein
MHGLIGIVGGKLTIRKRKTGVSPVLSIGRSGETYAATYEIIIKNL